MQLVVVDPVIVSEIYMLQYRSIAMGNCCQRHPSSVIKYYYNNAAL